MVKLHDPYTSSSAASNRDTAPATWLGPNAFTSLTPHRHLPSFAASSSSPTISIYDLSRPSSTPSQTLTWPTSVDSINAVAFNQVQSNILASAASDRGLVFYDLVSGKALHRTVLGMAGNAISWNPMEAFNVAVACEDHNIYIFDMRSFGTAGVEKRPRALNILKGHVSAVMDVEFSPTGEELVSASYDRSIRLWRRNEGHARDVYHTKRMQRVFSARFTPDNNYIISGSDDGNVRLWRANASARSGIKTARQRQNLEYAGALKERYKHLPEIRRISRHRHVPKQIMKAGEIKAEELKSIKRKEENERKNSRKGLKQRRSEREKMVLATEQ